MQQPRVTFPEYSYCDVSREEIHAMLETDPVLIGYKLKEDEHKFGLQRATEYEAVALARRDSINKQIMDLEGALDIKKREMREATGEVKCARYKQALQRKYLAQSDARWKRRELALFKGIITKKLRTLKQDLLPEIKFAKSQAQ